VDIGQERRVLRIEPIVDPVPGRDQPDRPAELRPRLPHPTPRSGAVPIPRRPRSVTDTGT